MRRSMTTRMKQQTTAKDSNRKKKKKKKKMGIKPRMRKMEAVNQDPNVKRETKAKDQKIQQVIWQKT